MMERSVLFVAALNWEATTIVPAIDGQVVSRRGPFTLWKGRSGIASTVAASRWRRLRTSGARDAVGGGGRAAYGRRFDGLRRGACEAASTSVTSSWRTRSWTRAAETARTSAEWRERYHRASRSRGTLPSRRDEFSRARSCCSTRKARTHAAEARGGARGRDGGGRARRLLRRQGRRILRSPGDPRRRERPPRSRSCRPRRTRTDGSPRRLCSRVGPSPRSIARASHATDGHATLVGGHSVGFIWN